MGDEPEYKPGIEGNPTVNTLKDIAEIIGCEVGDFFRDEGDGSAMVVCSLRKAGDGGAEVNETGFCESKG